MLGQNILKKVKVASDLFVVTLLILAFYLAIAWVLLPPEAFWSPDTGAKLLQLQNLRLENNRLAYDIQYPGKSLDPELQFVQSDSTQELLAVCDGKLYFQRLPIFPLLSLPLFRWLGFRGLYLLPALGGAASSVLALTLLKQRDQSLVMWMLIAFGSPIYIYATLFWEHTLATVLGLAAAKLALYISSATQKSPWCKLLGWITVGTGLGISAYIRLEMVIFALALLFAFWIVGQGGRWWPVWAGVALGLIMLPYRPLHGLLFAGQEMPDNATYLFYPFAYLSDAGWRAVPDLLMGPFVDEAIDTGLLGVLWASAAIVAISVDNLDVEKSRVSQAIYLTALAINVVAGVVFLLDGTFYRSAHGLLFTTPWAVLGLSRARRVWQHGDWRTRIIVSTTTLGLIGYIVGILVFRASSPHGGLEWGARFAMTFYPLLALIAVWGLKVERNLTLILVGALLFLGFGFQARGIWTIRHDKQINAALNRAIIEMPEEHVVSDLWWLPLNAAPIYPQKSFFVTESSSELEDWVEKAANRQIWQFSLVTLDDHLLKDANRALSNHRLTIMGSGRIENLLIFQVMIESND